MNRSNYKFKLNPVGDSGEYEIMDGNIYVATVHGSGESDRYATLLSTAPELLEALKACQTYMLGKCTELDLIETAALADAAIAKSEGKMTDNKKDMPELKPCKKCKGNLRRTTAGRTTNYFVWVCSACKTEFLTP